MDDHKDKDQMKEVFEQVRLDQLTSSDEILSQYRSQYIQFFQDLEEMPISLENVAQKLLKKSIRFLPLEPHLSEPAISIHRKSKGSEIVILLMKWGKFQQQISIINFAHHNPYILSDSSQNKKQERSILYSRQGENYDQIIFKNQPFQPKSRYNIILMVLKQVFLSKIASALEFGPLFSPQVCFDILLYENSIQFCMEKCVGFRERSFKRVNKNPLISGLRLMHSLGIIHYDIKPDNIMFSPSLNKLVTIDFNLSDITNLPQGRKTRLPFRGTLNFCSPEMIQNFSLMGQTTNFVDPYYNDIYSLKESFLFINQNHIELEENRQIVTNERHMQRSQCRNLLLNFKSLLFSQNWSKVQNLISRYKAQFEGKSAEIAQFLYELDITEGLERFYFLYIPSRDKDSLCMREFNYLIAKKWVMHFCEVSAIGKKSIQFNRRLEGLDRKEKVRPKIIRKGEMKRFLENEDKFRSDTAMYFNLFLDYVSFHCNFYTVDRQEREQAARICHGLILHFSQPQDEITFSQTSSQNQYSKLVPVLLYILPWAIKQISISNKQVSENNEKIKLLKAILLKLINFIFILDIGTLDELLSWLGQIFSAYSKLEEKITFLICIKQLNQWNKSRIKKKHGKSRYYVFFKISQFVKVQLNSLQSHSSNEINKILKDIQQGKPVKNDVFESIFAYSLSDIIKIENFTWSISQSLHDSNSLQKMHKQLLVLNKQSIPQFKSFYFFLYVWYRSYGEIKLCFHLYKTFQENLNDRILEKEFNIYYHHLSTELINQTNVQTKIDCLNQYMDKLDGSDLIFNHYLIDSIDIVGEFVYDGLEITKNIQYRSIKQKTQFLYQRLNKMHQQYHKNTKLLLNSLSTHICFSIDEALDFYLINLTRFKSIQQYELYLKEHQELPYYSNCKQCRYSFKCLKVVCFLNWILAFMPQNAIKLFQKSEQLFTKIQNEQQFLLTKNHCNFSVVQFYLLICSAILSYNFNQSKGVLKLYFFVKQSKIHRHVSYVWVYLGCKRFNKILLSGTMKWLFRQQPLQFIYFLQILSDFLSKNLSQKNINMITFSFTEVVQNLSQQGLINLFILMKMQSLECAWKKQAFRTYYYVIALHLQNLKIQLQLFYQVALSIKYLPFDFQNYYSSEIHRFFVLILRKNEKQHSRQERYLNNRLVWLSIQLGKLDQRPLKRFVNMRSEFYVCLSKKLQKLDGIYRIGDGRLNNFRFQTKRKQIKKFEQTKH